jgi:hypothetical protein
MIMKMVNHELRGLIPGEGVLHGVYFQGNMTKGGSE